MTRSFGLVAVLIVAAVGAYLFTRQTQSVTSIGSNPETTVDVTAVRGDLLTIARAEQNYFASNGKYVLIDVLRSNGDIQIEDRRNYKYSAEITDTTFKIIAVYSGSDPKAPKRITVDETITLKTD